VDVTGTIEQNVYVRKIPGQQHNGGCIPYVEAAGYTPF
jgi:hypothetical protein